MSQITIPESVGQICFSAFSSCTNLKSFTIPNGISSIAAGTFYTFYNCTSLTSVTIPDSVNYICEDAFCNCSSLTSIKIPNSVTTIKESLFSDCSSLTSVTIPNRVTSIDDWAFANCTSLTSITILNPECKIDNYDVISNGYDNYNSYFNGIIYGYENSTAQKYAKKYGYKFESLGEAPKTEIKGNANKDGIVNIADAVMLQKWLLGAGDLIKWQNADLCEDGKIDVFDMIEMRKLLVQNK